MSYKEAIEAAGAEVHEFKEFGSYQGDWFALATYNGERGWISGSYGSCSGCDSFEAEFSWTDEECDDHKYGGSKEECVGCAERRAAYAMRLADFGKTYCDGIQSAEMLLKELDERSEWDDESRVAAEWIRSLEPKP